MHVRFVRFRKQLIEIEEDGNVLRQFREDTGTIDVFPVSTYCWGRSASVMMPNPSKDRGVSDVDPLLVVLEL